MAEFVEVMKHKERMCDVHIISCANCNLIYEVRNKGCSNCEDYVEKYPQEAEEIIMKWAKEHPIKTNADKFKEVFGVEFSNNAAQCCEFIQCPNVDCDGCQYKDFWQQEYKGSEV